MPVNKVCSNINGHQVCFNIPELQRPPNWPFPDPDPLRLGRILIGDLTLLAEINDKAAKLSPDLKAAVYKNLDATVSQMKLPQGAFVSFSR
jgi:hypothetical protein